MTHVDPYTAARDIRELVRKGIVRLPQKGGRVYHLSPDLATPRSEKPNEYRALEPVLAHDGFVQNRHIREALGVSLHQANRIARRLVELGWLRPTGERRGPRYVPAQ